MNHASCTDDGQIYNAVEFSGLFPADLEKKRRQLQCPECGGPAFFRHTSPIGEIKSILVYGMSLALVDQAASFC